MNAYGAVLGVPQPNFQGDARSERSRQARTPAMALRIRFGRFELDEQESRLLCDGNPVDLPPRPFEVLCALARRPGSLVTKDALLDEVWGHRFVSESVLKTVIGKLRTALRDDARNPRFIETVQRRGYRFIAPEGVASGDSQATARVERPHPPGPDAAGAAAERVLREIRDVLLLAIEQPHERHRAAERIVDTVGRWISAVANDGSLLLAQAAVELGPAPDRNPTVR